MPSLHKDLVDFLKFFRNCAFCKRGNFYGVDLFCENCWRDIFLRTRKAAHSPMGIKNISVYPLLIWEGKDPILERLLYSIKGGGLPSACQRLARVFLSHYIQLGQSTNLVICPIPASQPGRDHALELGKGMAQTLGVPIIEALKWQNKRGPQKNLLKSERAHLKMEALKPLKLQRKTKIIIVDDIVTTGSTIRAAYDAIQGPYPIEVWCLACRL